MWKIELKVNYPKLSKQQQKAADYLLQQEELAGTMTIRECAEGAAVGQPTILRMLKKCGYESWSFFQHEVWKSMGQETEVLELAEYSNGKREGLRQSGVLQIIRDDIQMIADMAGHLDMNQLNQLVKIMKKAKIIDVYGTDNSANAAAELSGRLLHLGLTSRNYSDLFFQKISAGHLGEKDVAVSFSISGETIAVIEALKAAKQCGAVTVAVTGDAESALAECADYVFITPTIYAHEVSKWIASRISQIAFVDTLCAAIMESDMKRFSEQLSKSTREFEEDISERAKQME
ncbi:MAG: MurR/RpiR family transcriptional regulator [Roseburia sp.]